MAKQKARAVEKQLDRALKQREWLKKNLPNSRHLRDCEREILVKRTELVVTHQQIAGLNIPS
jgi:hypothetical protein